MVYGIYDVVSAESRHDSVMAREKPTVYYANCRSLNEKTCTELKDEIVNTIPYIVCLTETWLNKEKEGSIDIPRYNVEFIHRLKKGAVVWPF